MTKLMHELTPEQQYLKRRKEAQANAVEAIKVKNALLVGEAKEYRGIQYKMNQRGNYECINLQPLSGLDGTFTTTHVLHKAIDTIKDHS